MGECDYGYWHEHRQPVRLGAKAVAAPFASTAAEWEARWQEAARHGLRHKHEAERRGERIDRLRPAVADLRAERDALAAALAAVLALCDGLEQMNAPDMHPELHEVCWQVRAAARVEHPEPAEPTTSNRCPTYDPATDDCRCFMPDPKRYRPAAAQPTQDGETL